MQMSAATAYVVLAERGSNLHCKLTIRMHWKLQTLLVPQALNSDTT